MYKLFLVGKEREAFVKLVKVKMAEQDLTIKDIAEKTGYQPITIYKFLGGYDDGKFIAAAIVDALKLKRGDWLCYMQE